MAGRPAKPIQLHKANGNRRHLTKAEIEERERQEAKLRSGQRVFKPNDQVKADKVAKAMFNRLKKLFAEIEYIEALDENVINRYCLLHSECVSLQGVRNSLTTMLEKLTGEDEETIAKRLGIADRILYFDKGLQKKMDMLLKLEDRLFLNPTARIKNVPKKAEEPKKKETPYERMFGSV